MKYDPVSLKKKYHFRLLDIIDLKKQVEFMPHSFSIVGGYFYFSNKIDDFILKVSLDLKKKNVIQCSSSLGSRMVGDLLFLNIPQQNQIRKYRLEEDKAVLLQTYQTGNDNFLRIINGEDTLFLCTTSNKAEVLEKGFTFGKIGAETIEILYRQRQGFQPAGFAVDKKQVYIFNCFDNNYYIFAGDSGELINRIEPEALSKPARLVVSCINDEGYLFLIDNKDCFYKYQKNGELVYKTGAIGTKLLETGGFQTDMICVENMIYALDSRKYKLIIIEV